MFKGATKPTLKLKSSYFPRFPRGKCTHRGDHWLVKLSSCDFQYLGILYSGILFEESKI